MFIAAALSFAITMSCTNEPTAPAAQAVAHRDSLPPAPTTVHGQTTLAIVINSQGVIATPVSGSTNGEAVPVLAAPPELQGDSVVRLMISLRNDGALRLYEPAAVVIRQDAFTHVSGREVASSAFRIQAPGLSTAGTQVQLRYDSLLAVIAVNPPGRRYVPAAGTSAGEQIDVVVPNGVHAFDITISARATKVYTIGSTAPAHVADSIAASAQKNLVTQGDLAHFAVTADRLWLIFKTGATLDQRQAALDAVDGTVIGSAPLGAPNGYYVRFPASAGGGDVPLLHAIGALTHMPGVRTAIMDHHKPILSPNYLRPHDGSGWTTWQLQPSQATGENWGEEAVAAPLAWGCSAGDSSIRAVAIVDSKIYPLADLKTNMASDTETSTDTSQHGTFVASIIGAIGNNSKGMTGMVWRTELGFFNTLRHITGDSSVLWQYDAVKRAGRAGYPVINISLGINWTGAGGVGHAPRDTSHADSSLANGVRDELELAAIDSIRTSGYYPLLVLAAGNDGVDACWNGTPAVKLDGNYKRQVVVVASNDNNSNNTGTLSSFSNRDSLVDLAAPGGNVYVLNKSSSLVSESGTSLSAPFVSGAAGQLVSFDASLATDVFPGTDSLKSKLIHGALDGGRTAGGFPILNAYKALERAAQRVGAPLCGNRLFSDTNGVTIYAERAAGTLDSIGSWNYSSSDGYAVGVHGGRAVYSTQAGSITYTGGAWQSNPADTTFQTLSGVQVSGYNLATGLNHDGDSALSAFDSTQQILNVYVGLPSSQRFLGAITTTGLIWNPIVAFSPVSQTAFVAIQEVNVGATDYWTDVYSVPIASGTQTATLVRHLDSLQLVSLAFAEDGSQAWAYTYWPLRASNKFADTFWDPSFNLLESRVSTPGTIDGGIAPSRVSHVGTPLTTTLRSRQTRRSLPPAH